LTVHAPIVQGAVFARSSSEGNRPGSMPCPRVIAQ
jgi:hypothetical protein